MRESQLISLAAPDVAAMRSLGAAIADGLRAIEQPFVIALEGELGAGKTTLVGGVLNRLGFAGHARSPTYTLIEPYEFGARSVYHLDLYRLADPSEVEALGLRDLLLPHSVFLIEWPQRGGAAIPPADVTVRIGYAAGDSGREIALSAGSMSGQSVLQSVSPTTTP